MKKTLHMFGLEFPQLEFRNPVTESIYRPVIDDAVLLGWWKTAFDSRPKTLLFLA